MYVTYYQLWEKVNCKKNLSFRIPFSYYDEYGRCTLSYYEKS